MSDDPVAWLGRALGSAARRSLRIIRRPKEAWRRSDSDREAPEPTVVGQRGEAQIVGARLRPSPTKPSTSSSHPTDLSEALAHPDPAVRVKTLRALGALSKQRAEHLLAPMLHDPHPEVRAQAAETAADLGAESAVFSLIAGLEDEHQRVRDACYDAMHEITQRTPWTDRLDAVERAQKVIELRAWWKQERLGLLLSRAKRPTAAGAEG